jgi:cytochrome b561
MIHWLFACYLIAMLSIGFYMKNTSYNPEIYQFHKSFGVLICLLIIGRLFWRSKHVWQSSALGTSKAPLVNFFHLALITLMILMPVTGLMVSAFSGFGIHLFGTFIVPEYFDAEGKVTPFSPIIYQASKVFHNFFAYTFSLLISSHILMALKHHFIDKDNTLIHMFSNKR